MWYILNISRARETLAVADGTGPEVSGPQGYNLQPPLQTLTLHSQLPPAPTADFEREERARWWAEHPLDNQASILDFYDECSRRAAGSSVPQSGESVTITRGSSLTVNTSPRQEQQTPPPEVHPEQSGSTGSPDSRHVRTRPGSPPTARAVLPGDKECQGDSSVKPPNTLEAGCGDAELAEEAGAFCLRLAQHPQPAPGGASRASAPGFDLPSLASRSDIGWPRERTHAGLSGLAAIATDTFRLVGLSPPESPAPAQTIPGRHSSQGCVGEDLGVDLVGQEEPPPPPYMTHVTPGSRIWADVGPGVHTAGSNVRHGGPTTGQPAPGPNAADDEEQGLHKSPGSPAPPTPDVVGPVNGDAELVQLALPPPQTDPVLGALGAFPIGRTAPRDRRALARNPLKRRSAGKAGTKSKRQKDIFW